MSLINIKANTTLNFTNYIITPNKLLIVLILLFAHYPTVYCQAKLNSEAGKSATIKTIDGTKYYIHKIEKGQTLYSIAKIYNCSVGDIVMENPGTMDGIKAGMELKIAAEKHTNKNTSSVAKKTEEKKIKPIAESTEKSEDVFILHKVEKGQTLYAISKIYNVPVNKINASNPEIKNGLGVNQIIKIPKSGSFPEAIKINPSTEKAVVINKPAPVENTETKEISTPVIKTANNTITTATTNEVAKTEIKTPPPVAVNQTKAVNSNNAISVTKLGYPGEKKSEYNIAFFLPFHAAEALDKGIEKLVRGEDQFSNKTNIALQFYDGALLAIDSLKKQNLNAKIFVYDIDDNDSLSIPRLLKKPELLEMDLMIGPLYASSFTPVAKFAKEHSIPIVSPFVQANKILFDNPFVCKATSSSLLQVVQMANFVIDTFHSQNIILVNSGNKKEQELCTTFKNIARETAINKMYPYGDSVKEAKGIIAISSMLHPTKTNVVVLPSSNQSYVTEFINAINAMQEGKKIVVFGLQSWMNYDNLDFEYLNSLSLHIVSNNYINYNDPVTKNFTNKFRTTYKTNPDNFAYSGFDIAYYFISSLQKYGKGFLNDIADNLYKGISTNMHFVKTTNNKSGYENKYVFVLKYKNYELVPAN